jgi:hypothetical protein
MYDLNVSNYLRQLSLGQVKALEYSRYDINGYHFWTAKLEATRPLAATINSGLEQVEKMLPATLPTITTFLKILLSTRSAAREMKVVFFKCDWFDPINGTRVDDFDMVEVKHESRYSGINLLLAHQAQ